MVWDTDAYNVTIKALGTVESNMNYGAVSVADPISIGAFQWYGTRAAALLFLIQDDATLSFDAYCPTTISDDMDDHDATDSWWNDRIITKGEHNALYDLLTQTDVIDIQLTQIHIDITQYLITAARWGIDQDYETQTLEFFCTVYHQSPRAASQIVTSLPTNSTLEDIYSATLNNSIVGPYRSRQETVYNIIKAQDQSGIDTSTGSPPPIDDGFDGNEPSPNGNNDGSNGHKRKGTDHHIIDRGHLRLLYTDKGDVVKFYKSGGVWLPEDNKHVGSLYPGGGKDPVINIDPDGIDIMPEILKVYTMNNVTAASKVVTITNIVPIDSTIIIISENGGGTYLTNVVDTKSNGYNKTFGDTDVVNQAVMSVWCSYVTTELVNGDQITLTATASSSFSPIILIVSNLKPPLKNSGKIKNYFTESTGTFNTISDADTTADRTFQIAAIACSAAITDTVQAASHYLPDSGDWTYVPLGVGITSSRVAISTKIKETAGTLSASIGTPGGNSDRGIFAFNCVQHIPASPPDTEPPLPEGGPVAKRIVNYARSKLGHYSYSQGPGRMNPEKSGYCDCSSFLIFCYQVAGNVSLGGATYTGTLCTKGTLIKEGGPTLAQMALGDFIFLRWGSAIRDTSPFDHVEMYSGGGKRISMGHTPGPNELDWDVDINSALSNGGRVQIRRCL